MHQIRDCVWYALLEQREGHRLWGIWTKSKDQKTNALFGSKSWFCWGKTACFPVLLHQCFHLWSFISVMGRRHSSVKTPDRGAFSSPSPESRGQTSRGSALQWAVHPGLPHQAASGGAQCSDTSPRQVPSPPSTYPLDLWLFLGKLKHNKSDLLPVVSLLHFTKMWWSKLICWS